jgi:hypothetical protein
LTVGFLLPAINGAQASPDSSPHNGPLPQAFCHVLALELRLTHSARCGIGFRGWFALLSHAAEVRRLCHWF